MSAIALDTRLKTYASFVKLEHTIFSLPLIFAGAWLHGRAWPSGSMAALLLVAAAGARVVAMGVNRVIDAEIDGRNPRTQRRELPRGAMRRWEAWAIIAAGGLAYAAAAAAIGPVCLRYAPIPVALFVIYPYLKRFTSLAHLGLGIAWSMAPLAGWLAASQSLAGFGEIMWLWLFSILWVAGFDVIYATMDETFDRNAKLHSLPVALGSKRALRVAAVCHAAAWLSLAALWWTQLRTPISFAWLAATGALFIWQHAVAERKPEFAFFQLNGLVGFVVLGLVVSGR